MNILYTTEAVVEGGRAGHGRSSDGRLAVELSVPKELGGEGGPGTNPEQLFAVGYAACFHSGLLAVAQGRQRDASDSTVTAHVGIGPTGRGGFGLAVALDLHAPHLSRVDAEDLMRRAHALFPYSNATRGNVDVTLRVDGTQFGESDLTKNKGGNNHEQDRTSVIPNVPEIDRSTMDSWADLDDSNTSEEAPAISTNLKRRTHS